MALLFMDGFDAGDALVKWTSYSGGNSSSTDTRFGSGRSWAINDKNNFITKSIPAATQLFLGFALKFSGYSNGAQAFLYLQGDSGATTHLQLQFTNNTTLSLLRGGTAIATASLAPPQSWSTYFEVSATINATTGTCVVKANGSTIINFTGNTKNGGTNTTIDTFSFYGTQANFTAYSTIIDDLYVCDATGSAPYNTFLGDVRINTLSPSGAGTTTGFTPSAGVNYTDVDELPYSASDYVTASASGTRDTYAMTDLSGSYTVLGVQNNIIAKKVDAGGTAIKPTIVSGGTAYYGTSKVLGTTDTTISDLRVVDPATSAAWTITGVNAMEAGMEIA